MPFKTALITGASSGIGKEFALALAKQRKWNLILVARRQEALQQVREDIYQLWNDSIEIQELPTVDIESIDLASECNRTAMLDRIHRGGKSIDFLINNAGFARLESFYTSDISQNLRMIELHCAAPLHLCRAVLPEMLANHSGIIINVCSRRALVPMPLLACYAATKTFLLYFSVALAEEVKGKGIKILALCPGATDTSGNILHFTQKKIFKPMMPQQVVNAALQAMESNSSIYVVGIWNQIIFGLLRMLPMTLAAKIQGFKVQPHLRILTSIRKPE